MRRYGDADSARISNTCSTESIVWLYLKLTFFKPLLLLIFTFSPNIFNLDMKHLVDTKPGEDFRDFMKPEALETERVEDLVRKYFSQTEDQVSSSFVLHQACVVVLIQSC